MGEREGRLQLIFIRIILSHCIAYPSHYIAYPCPLLLSIPLPLHCRVIKGRPSLLFVLSGRSPSDFRARGEGLCIFLSGGHEIVLLLDQVVLPLDWTRIGGQVVVGNLPFLLHLLLGAQLLIELAEDFLPSAFRLRRLDSLDALVIDIGVVLVRLVGGSRLLHA